MKPFDPNSDDEDLSDCEFNSGFEIYKSCEHYFRHERNSNEPLDDEDEDED